MWTLYGLSRFFFWYVRYINNMPGSHFLINKNFDIGFQKPMLFTWRISFFNIIFWKLSRSISLKNKTGPLVADSFFTLSKQISSFVPS